MTGPVTTDDIVQGCWEWLAAFPDVTAVLGTYPGTGTPYLFAHRPFQTMEGTGSTGAVITYNGGWTGPNLTNTMVFPRIGVTLLVDPPRDAGNNSVDPAEPVRRAFAAHAVIDRRLHRPQGEVQYWGGIRTLSCVRLNEPTAYVPSDGDGLITLETFYAVTQG